MQKKIRPRSQIYPFDESVSISHKSLNTNNTNNYQVWYYHIADSDYFEIISLTRLLPSDRTQYIIHNNETGGDLERLYIILKGNVTLQTPLGKYKLRKFDSIFCPDNLAHQFQNEGLEECLIGSIVLTKNSNIGFDDFIKYAINNRHEVHDDFEDCDYNNIADEPTIWEFNSIDPVLRTRSKSVGGSERFEWFVEPDELDSVSSTDIICLDPGKKIGFHTHMPEYEGQVEEIYWIFNEKAQLRTEYFDKNVNKYDLIFFPPGSSHQIYNCTLNTLWFGAWIGSDSTNSYKNTLGQDRTGYIEEYKRIIEARKRRGLPIPPETLSD